MKTQFKDRSKVKTESITFSVTSDEKDEYFEIALGLGLTLSSLVRVAVKDYVRRLGR